MTEDEQQHADAQNRADRGDDFESGDEQPAPQQRVLHEMDSKAWADLNRTKTSPTKAKRMLRERWHFETTEKWGLMKYLEVIAEKMGFLPPEP